MGYKFSLVLSREITAEESAILQNAGCASAVFTTDTLPTDAAVVVTRLEFDDTVSPSLAEAIESGLDAVRNVPELSVPGLSVPAQPSETQATATQTQATATQTPAVATQPPAIDAEPAVASS